MDFVNDRPDEPCRDSCSSFTEGRSVAIGRTSGLMERLRTNTGYSALMESPNGRFSWSIKRGSSDALMCMTSTSGPPLENLVKELEKVGK
jgi:hypothetical protein